MPKFLFWNINRKPLEQHIAALCHEHEVDVLVLAESKINPNRMLSVLNERRQGTYAYPLDLSRGEIVQFYIGYPGAALEPLADTSRLTIRRLSPPLGEDFLIAALHLPSKLHTESHDQELSARHVLTKIEAVEQRFEHDRTLILGDFNMSPFEPGMAGVHGFHSVMDRDVAKSGGRTVQGEDYDFLYNPMWGRMGDTSEGRPGTYYHSGGGALNYYWHTFDQVLLRPSLIDCFDEASLRVLDSAGTIPLVNARGRPSVSDHLPLFFEIRTEGILT